jgi:hypothetical protein
MIVILILKDPSLGDVIHDGRKVEKPETGFL